MAAQAWDWKGLDSWEKRSQKRIVIEINGNLIECPIARFPLIPHTGISVFDSVLIPFQLAIPLWAYVSVSPFEDVCQPHSLLLPLLLFCVPLPFCFIDSFLPLVFRTFHLLRFSCSILPASELLFILFAHFLFFAILQRHFTPLLWFVSYSIFLVSYLLMPLIVFLSFVIYSWYFGRHYLLPSLTTHWAELLS